MADGAEGSLSDNNYQGRENAIAVEGCWSKIKAWGGGRDHEVWAYGSSQPGLQIVSILMTRHENGVSLVWSYYALCRLCSALEAISSLDSTTALLDYAFLPLVFGIWFRALLTMKISFLPVTANNSSVVHLRVRRRIWLLKRQRHKKTEIATAI